LLLHKRFWF